VIDMVVPEARPTPHLAGRDDASPETLKFATPAGAAPPAGPAPVIVTGPVISGLSRAPIAWGSTLNGISPGASMPVPGDRTLPIYNTRRGTRLEDKSPELRPSTDDPPPLEKRNAADPGTALMPLAATETGSAPAADKRGLLGRPNVDLSKYFIYADQITASMKSRPPEASAPNSESGAEKKDRASSAPVPTSSVSRVLIPAAALALVIVAAAALVLAQRRDAPPTDATFELGSAAPPATASGAPSAAASEVPVRTAPATADSEHGGGASPLAGDAGALR
jgi:hypothetical protein